MTATIPALFTAVALLLLGGCTQRAPRPSADKRILEIGSQSIYLDEFQQYVDDTIGEEDAGGEGPAGQDDPTTLSRLLDQFVEEELLLQQARKQGVQVGDAELQAFLELQGLAPTVSDPSLGGDSLEASNRFRSRVRKSLLLQRFKDQVVLKDVVVSDEEVESFFREHPGGFHGGSTVILRQILVDEEPLARRIRSELQLGASFQELAERHTLAPDRGEARQYEEADLPEEIQAVVNSLRKGEVSGIVNIGGQYRVFLLEARRGRSLQALEDVRERIKFTLLRRKTGQAMEQYISELRSRVPIRVYHDNLPFDYAVEPGH